MSEWMQTAPDLLLEALEALNLTCLEGCVGPGLCDGSCVRTILAAHDDPPRPEGVGTGAGEGAPRQDTGSAWVTRSADCPEAPAQAHPLAADDPPAPVGVERVEWGVQGERQVMRMPGEGNARWYAETTGLPVVRRTVTSYPDVVGEWEEVGE